MYIIYRALNINDNECIIIFILYCIITHCVVVCNGKTVSINILTSSSSYSHLLHMLCI